MLYLLEDNIRIHRWKNGLARFTVEGKPKRFPLGADEYALLLKCDGLTELAANDTLYGLEAMRVIRRCRNGEAGLKPGQIREYPNVFIHNLEWTITECCNYNCLHCFHAADNDVHREAFSREEAYRLLREAEECGIAGISLTGGEPTLYPFFREIVEEIGNRGMELTALVTNGSQLDEELIAFLRERHPRAEIRISFDGIGTHDWLRQHPGSEERAREAIRLCRDAGMRVQINMNVNRRNRDVIFDSVNMLVGLNVNKIRIIKTTEAPRWQLNAAGDSLTIEEYYDFSADFAAQYRRSGLRVPVAIWQSLYLNGEKEEFGVLPVKTSPCRYREDALLCSALTRKLSVQANGDLIPCAPLAGLFTSRDMHMGNVKTDGLQKLLSGGPMIEQVMQTVEDKRQANEKCAGCRYFRSCQGGCPALSMLFGGSLLSSDLYKCAFFENGFYERFCQVLDGWKNLNPMD